MTDAPASGLDAIQFEVIRNRLVAITDPSGNYRIEKGEKF